MMAGIMCLRRMLVVLATIGLSIPQALGGDIDATTKQVVHDVQLDAAKALHVVVVDAQGQPQRGAEINVTRSGSPQTIVRKTNDRGECTFDMLRGGVYRLQTSEGVCLCRVWTTEAAPPIAAKRLLIVNDRSVRRGQRPVREMFRSDPILMTALVAAAIAIPIAVHKSRDNDATGS